VNPKPTPLTNLLARKKYLQQQSLRQEQKLNDAFSYIQENTASLLLTGVSSLLFPKAHSGSKANTSAQELITQKPAAVPFGWPEYLSVGKILVPLLWEMAQQMIISWGVRKTVQWVGRVFTRKGKR
jgi:hypothetical protein